ncbi:hypothetical protein BpHYR1_040675 [Brachionus plicatilis]|uniref:Uncharacterized protein n=1 Tax=Brachionus plicatilis TaxID=10195 RepID=A0A3M7SD35_BRAPC|nr:hypothetical protein BpHYR1_040675 [Brachionus plicatilis]
MTVHAFKVKVMESQTDKLLERIIHKTAYVETVDSFVPDFSQHFHLKKIKPKSVNRENYLELTNNSEDEFSVDQMIEMAKKNTFPKKNFS